MQLGTSTDRDGSLLKEAISVLFNAGANVWLTTRVHSKTLAFDEALVVEGSFNWLSAPEIRGWLARKHHSPSGEVRLRLMLPRSKQNSLSKCKNAKRFPALAKPPSPHARRERTGLRTSSKARYQPVNQRRPDAQLLGCCRRGLTRHRILLGPGVE